MFENIEKRTVLSAALFALVLGPATLFGCGTQGDPTGQDAIQTDDPATMQAIDDADLDEQLSVAPSGFYRMVKSLGGYTAYDQLMESGDAAAIEEIHRKFEVVRSDTPPEAVPEMSPDTSSAEVSSQGASDVGTATSASVTDREYCPQFFPSQNRDKLYTLNGHRVYIDKLGRPGYAFRIFPAETPRPRTSTRTRCQTTVGTWGIRGADGDVGGHMIPDVLGGWPGRANIVPQNRNMNLSTWRIVENATVGCVGKALRTTYRVTAIYKGSGVRPDRFTAEWSGWHRHFGIPWPAGSQMVSMFNRRSSPAAYDVANRYRRYVAARCD